MIVLNTKNYTLLLFVLLVNTVCFGQRFPVQYPKADYLQPEKFIFDEHIDSSKVKSLTKLTAKYRNPKVLDTFYIEYFNTKGKVEKKISFSSNRRYNITRNFYKNEQLTEGTWYNLNTGTRTQLLYSYDNDGKLIHFSRKEVFKEKSTNFEDYSSELLYKNNRIIKNTTTIKNSALAGKSEQTFKYNDTLLVETIRYSEKTQIKTRSLYFYDEMNRQKQQQAFMESLYYKEPHQTADRYFYYNSEDLLVKDSAVFYDDKLTKVTEFRYDATNRLTWMKEHITKKGKENTLESSFIYENDRLVAIKSILLKNLAYVYWRIPICNKPAKESLGKPIKADILMTYDAHGSRIKTEYTLENYPNCYTRKNHIEYRD
jgi:hypothetical protein